MRPFIVGGTFRDIMYVCYSQILDELDGVLEEKLARLMRTNTAAFGNNTVFV